MSGEINDPYGIEFKRVNLKDECLFLENINNWCNHRPLLLLALHLTAGDVCEFGAGDGSTPYLREYCRVNDRHFQSWENNIEWSNKCAVGFVDNWDTADIWHPCGLAFIDHAPGEHRKVAVERMMDRAQIICVHDTEIGGAGDYGFEPVFARFKFRLNYNRTGGGAGATLVSNSIDVNWFRGLSLGPYTFDND